MVNSWRLSSLPTSIKGSSALSLASRKSPQIPLAYHSTLFLWLYKSACYQGVVSFVLRKVFCRCSWGWGSCCLLEFGWWGCRALRTTLHGRHRWSSSLPHCGLHRRPTCISFDLCSSCWGTSSLFCHNFIISSAHTCGLCYTSLLP